jgi:hypothetical protein
MFEKERDETQILMRPSSASVKSLSANALCGFLPESKSKQMSVSTNILGILLAILSA